MSKIFVFKVSNSKKKSIWRTIEIREAQTLGHFDAIIKELFNLDFHDHLSEFYKGKLWDAIHYGEIEPGGRGRGSMILIRNLAMNIGDKLGYVYDFGDSITFTIELIGINEVDLNTKYPRLVGRNKVRNVYCDKCKQKGKKSIAKYRVFDINDYSDEKLCEACMGELPENAEFDINEIVY